MGAADVAAGGKGESAAGHVLLRTAELRQQTVRCRDRHARRIAPRCQSHITAAERAKVPIVGSEVDAPHGEHRIAVVIVAAAFTHLPVGYSRL